MRPPLSDIGLHDSATQGRPQRPAGADSPSHGVMESWRTHAASASERARLQARHAANAALLPAPAPHEGIDSSTAARPSAQILALFTHANRKGTYDYDGYRVIDASA